ncbi:MAG: ROK family protein [Mycoplasma sp.]
MDKILIFDLGGSAIKYCIDSTNEFITHNIKDISSDYVINFITDLAKKEQPTHICISSPGLVDVDDGTVNGMSAIKGWCNINVFNLIKNKLDNKQIKIYIENDANCALLGCIAEQSKNISSAISIVVGTGIGGAYYENGKIIRGYSNSMCELGMIRDLNDPSKSVSTMLSTNALCNLVNNQLLTTYNGLEIFEQYHKGDEQIIKIVHKWIMMLATFVYNSIWSFDPEFVFVGGAIASNEIVAKFIPIEVDKLFAENKLMRKAQIVFAKNGNKLNLLGAKSLIK